jgi:AcrR family transcriptional regulator
MTRKQSDNQWIGLVRKLPASAQVKKKAMSDSSSDRENVVGEPQPKRQAKAAVKRKASKQSAGPLAYEVDSSGFEPRRRRTRVERQAETRRRILQSAVVIFQSRGFHPATLEEIAEMAGYSKGAVYSNFASKDDLFLALLDEMTDSRIKALSKVFSDVSDFDANLKRLSQRWQKILDAERPWSHVEYEFVLHALRFPELGDRLRDNNNRLREGVARIFEPHVKNIGDLDQITSAVMAIIRGVTFTNLQDPKLYRPTLHSLLLRRLFLRDPYPSDRAS